MPSKGNKKKASTSKKTSSGSKAGLAKGGRKYKISHQKKKDKQSKANAARQRHNTVMKAIGRGGLSIKSKKK